MADSGLLAMGLRDAPSPSAEEIRAAVDRITASPDFAASDRGRKFLRYVVEETLHGRSERIKAFSIAVEVFGRDETFDAQNDPVVRIEAGRLRRALERYYLLAGQDDPVVIDIPKGGYVPIFAARTVRAAPPGFEVAAPAVSKPPSPRVLRLWIQLGIAGAAIVLAATAGAIWYALSMHPLDANPISQHPASPSLVVLPFVDLGDGATSALYSAAITDEVVTALARFKEIAVLGVQTSRSVGPNADISRLRDDLKVQYVLEGSVRSDSGRVRVSSRLLTSATGAVLWSGHYEHPLTAGDLFAIPVETAEQVAAVIAQPYGIVFAAEAAREPSQRPPDDLGAYLCSLRYYVYRLAPSAEEHLAVRDCLEQAVARFPGYATAWALLSHAYVDEARHDLNPRPGAPSALERALDTSREAVRLDPENVRALQALATALFYNHRLAEAFEVGDKALLLNPSDTELLGQLGQLKGLSGRFDDGRALLEEALYRNPGHARFYRGVLAIIAYMQRDYDRAVAEIERADLKSLSIYHGVAAIIYAQKGFMPQAHAAAAEFQRLLPDFVPNLWAELDSRNIPVESQLHIAEGLRKAGVRVPPRPTISDAAGIPVE